MDGGIDGLGLGESKSLIIFGKDEGNRKASAGVRDLKPLQRATSLSTLELNGAGSPRGSTHDMLDQEFNMAQQRNLYGARAHSDNGFELGGVVTSSGQGVPGGSTLSPGGHRRRSAARSGLRRAVSDSGPVDPPLATDILLENTDGVLRPPYQ